VSQGAGPNAQGGGVYYPSGGNCCHIEEFLTAKAHKSEEGFCYEGRKLYFMTEFIIYSLNKKPGA
jgi:hypothetical protein